MRDDELDRILSVEREIIPSSGFAVSVMDAVRREASAPPPIPFPWRRALPGLCATGLALAAVIVTGITLFIHENTVHVMRIWLPASSGISLASWKNTGASWIALALVVSFASAKISIRYGSRER